MGKVTRYKPCKAVTTKGDPCPNEGHLNGYCLKHYCRMMGMDDRPAPERYARSKLGKV